MLGWGGGSGLELESHRLEVGADGKRGKQEVADGMVGLDTLGRREDSPPKQGSMGWELSDRNTGPTSPFVLHQVSKWLAQPTHHTGQQDRRWQGKDKPPHVQCKAPSDERGQCQTHQCPFAAGRGSIWTGRESLTQVRPGRGSPRWLRPPSSWEATPSASAPSRPEPWWPASAAATAPSLSSLPLRWGIATPRPLPSPPSETRLEKTKVETDEMEKVCKWSTVCR